MIPEIGPKNTVYPPMKLKKPAAFAKISHGANAHPPTIAQITWPLLIFRYLGHSAVKSLPADSEFAAMFVVSVARLNEKAAKNVAARLSHWSMRRSGSQRTWP